jgi:signal transduction histidine kinase/CheY-like chemotaxis protein
MQETGINSTFKKLIYESSEMVFLADDTYPYNIFYANEAFENTIGNTLENRTLAGLGLDINAYIFKEELILTYDEKYFGFRLELPQNSVSNYFLFYKGIALQKPGQPTQKETKLFFKSTLDLIGIGRHDFLTYLNQAILPILGYQPEELLNTSLCDYIQKNDLKSLKKLWKRSEGQEELFKKLRFKAWDNSWKYLECSFQFSEENFFVIARDITHLEIEKDKRKQLAQLKKDTINHSSVFSWEYMSDKHRLCFEPAGATLLGVSRVIEKDQFANNLEKLVFELFENAFLKNIDNSIDSDFSFDFYSDTEECISISGVISLFDSKLGDLIGLAWDSTKKSASENKISLLETLITNSPDSLLIVKSTGEVLICSNEAKMLLGFSKEEELNHLQQLDVVFGEVDLWKEWVQMAEAGAFSQRFLSLLISHTGKQLTLEISSKLNEIEGEKYISLSFKNISEKVSLEKTLEASSDFLTNLTEQVPGGLYQMVLDQEGKMSFAFLSKGIGSVLGLDSKEMESFTDISLAISRVHPLDLPNVITSSVASARKLEPWQCQFRVKSKPDSNDYRWILGAARPQSLENGDLVWYGYLTDISSQKEFETKLNEAKLAAEKANQIKSDFLSMISHELRTPLNAISGSTYSLLQDDHSSGQKSALNTINFAVDNLIIMINDLLDFQKIEAGKLTIERNPFNLHEFLNQIMKGLSFHAIDSKNILSLKISEGLDLIVIGDKTRLSQILNNLITNALKFTGEGEVDLKVNLVEDDKNFVKVYFEVQDTGIGIAIENQQKIFNDFDQVRPTFSTKYGGTGLGLSITRKLLNLMGGQIALESQVGKGSRFFFTLEFEKDTNIVSEKPQTNGTTISPTTLHLLMAEDNDVNALVLGKIIKKWGFTYDRVLNGQEAIDRFPIVPYDCVLMDIQMPVMDGFDATIGIKKISDTPVIALTAAAKLEIMERIEECGFDGFVAKPIDAAELLKKIREVISIKS